MPFTDFWSRFQALFITRGCFRFQFLNSFLFVKLQRNSILFIFIIFFSSSRYNMRDRADVYVGSEGTFSAQLTGRESSSFFVTIAAFPRDLRCGFLEWIRFLRGYLCSLSNFILFYRTAYHITRKKNLWNGLCKFKKFLFLIKLWSHLFLSSSKFFYWNRYES